MHLPDWSAAKPLQIVNVEDWNVGSSTEGNILRELFSSPARQGGPTAFVSITLLEICGDVRV